VTIDQDVHGFNYYYKPLFAKTIRSLAQRQKQTIIFKVEGSAGNIDLIKIK